MANPRRKKKKSKGPIIAIVVILVIIIAAAGLLFFNVANIRDSVFNVVRGWPVIGNLIPDAENGAAAPRLTPAELQTRNDQLRRQVDTLTRDVNSLREQNDNQRVEIERLREFEENQEQFVIDLADFHMMVMEHAGLSEFWRFFQGFNPDMAEEFAREAAGQARVDAEVRDFIRMMREMDPGTAADILEELMDVAAGEVVNILQNLTPAERSLVLESMSTEAAATVLRLMVPEGLIE